jgi:hypothetical protein
MARCASVIELDKAAQLPRRQLLAASRMLTGGNIVQPSNTKQPRYVDQCVSRSGKKKVHTDDPGASTA